MDYETAQDLFDALSAPFSTDAIDWRLGSTNSEKTQGRALAYIDARVVMDRLDTVCGPGDWQNNYPHAAVKTICNIGIRMPTGEWIWKSDGAGDTDVEADKGAMSDAFKRAGVRWGIGRYLYGMATPYVAIEPAGKSFKIKKEEFKKLDDAHDKEASRIGWGNPADIATYKFLSRVVEQTVTQPSDVIEFRQKNGGMISQLRVSARRHLNMQLDRIGGTQQEAAE